MKPDPTSFAVGMLIGGMIMAHTPGQFFFVLVFLIFLGRRAWSAITRRRIRLWNRPRNPTIEEAIAFQRQVESRIERRWPHQN